MQRTAIAQPHLLVRIILCAALGLLGSPPRVTAADQDKSIDLPTAPEAWLNSPPLGKDSLQGKCVAFWFYEEQCPNCRKKWPEMLQTAKSLESQQVVFVAVNSGTDRAAVEQYTKAVGVTWPVIVDTDRKFEAQWREFWGGHEINLSNVHQIAFLAKDGRPLKGQWEDIAGSVKRALEGRAVPKQVPGSFVPVWKQIQSGQFAKALPGLKKGLGSKEPDVKAAAQYAQDLVEARMRDAAKQAEVARSEGRLWEAYKAYLAMADRFEGYQIPEEIRTAAKGLGQDAEVQKQLVAQKALEPAKKALSAAKNAGQKAKAQQRLKEIATAHPGTEAAAEAEKLSSPAGNP
jgi:thiol-disulfide isomerase/thioredoxin